jgi:hypothetical protein
MKVNLWAKKGQVTVALVDSAKGAAPVLTVEMKDPQILYDEGTNKITIVETK